MEFCEDCDNMLCIQIKENEETGKSSLIYFCRNCNKEYTDKAVLDNCIYGIDYDYNKIKKESLINDFTHLDITLPRVNNIKCPCKECPSETPEIVYLKYDEENMRYLYICCDCKKIGNKEYYWYLD